MWRDVSQVRNGPGRPPPSRSSRKREGARLSEELPASQPLKPREHQVPLLLNVSSEGGDTHSGATSSALRGCWPITEAFAGTHATERCSRLRADAAPRKVPVTVTDLCVCQLSV